MNRASNSKVHFTEYSLALPYSYRCIRTRLLAIGKRPQLVELPPNQRGRPHKQVSLLSKSSAQLSPMPRTDWGVVHFSKQSMPAFNRILLKGKRNGFIGKSRARGSQGQLTQSSSLHSSPLVRRQKKATLSNPSVDWTMFSESTVRDVIFVSGKVAPPLIQLPPVNFMSTTVGLRDKREEPSALQGLRKPAGPKRQEGAGCAGDIGGFPKLDTKLCVRGARL
jgi:hypothetical protein